MGDYDRDLRGYDLVGLWKAGTALLRRVIGPPPVWTEADMVLPDAQPICHTCTQPHHRLAVRCPNCGEYVSPQRTLFYLDWVYVWGRGMQDTIHRRRLTPLLAAGLVVVAGQDLLAAALGWWGGYAALRGGDPKELWFLGIKGDRGADVALGIIEILTAAVSFAVFIRICEALRRYWGAGPEEEEEGG
jgi:hypothetical protein